VGFSGTSNRYRGCEKSYFKLLFRRLFHSLESVFGRGFSWDQYSAPGLAQVSTQAPNDRGVDSQGIADFGCG